MLKQDLLLSVHNAGGAMENWGLVIYRMNFLLYDEKTSVQNKAWVSGGECGSHSREPYVLNHISRAA